MDMERSIDRVQDGVRRIDGDHADGSGNEAWEGWDHEGMLGAVSLPSFVLDRGGRVVWGNKALVSRLDRPLKTILGLNCRQVFGCAPEDCKGCPLAVHPGTDARVTHEVSLPALEGVFLHSVSLLKEADGHTIHLLVDVSERVRLRAMLLQSEKLAALGQVVAGVAHEINNPLMAIMGSAELLFRQADLPDRARKGLERIMKESVRCGGIVRNLLTFAREHEPVWGPVDLNKALRETCELMTYRLRSTNVQIVEDYAQSLPLIHGDAHHLQQVFLNLIINAQQAMEESEERTVLLRTRLVVKPKAEEPGPGSLVQAMIRDTGPGIPQAILTRIFDPFFTTKAPGKGTGLGLSLSHGIVAAHKGRLYAESEEGQGASFYVEIPVRRAGGDR